MKSVKHLEKSIRRDKQAVLIVNTNSRKGLELFDEAVRKLESAGYVFTKVFKIRNPRQMELTIFDALALKPRLLVVGSGDGTLSTVVDHLAYTDTVLGYLPLGTTNNFGRSLGIAPRLDAAVDVIINGKVAAVDLGKVNDDYFGNMTSLGVSVSVAASVPGKLKRRIGRLAYALYAVKEVVRHRPFRVEIRTADSSHFFYTHMFCIANGTMHAGKRIAADASVDNGMLIAYAVGGRTRLSTAIATIHHSRSGHETMNHKNLLTGTKFTVTTFPHKRLEIDGEVGERPKDGVYAFEIATDALKVFVPQDFDDQ